MKPENIIEHLKTLVPIAEAVGIVPVIGPTLKGSLEAALKLAEVAETANANKEDMETLADLVSQWMTGLCKATNAARLGGTDLSKIQGEIDEANRMITTIKDVCQTCANTPFYQRFASAKTNTSRLQGLKEELIQAQLRFISNTAVYMGSSIASMYSHMEHKAIYEALGPVGLAEFDALGSRSGCMQGTRTYVLGHIQNWAETPSTGLSIFWLAGMAGTGKSTIAKTACERFFKNGMLGASFFVSRQEIERRDPHRVLRSIAYQLTLKDPAAFREVYQRVTVEPGISTRPMKEQMQKILVAPLVSAIASMPKDMVVVIDALDECDKLNGIASGDLLPLLASELSSFSIKLLVTSRNEHKFDVMREKLKPASLMLQDIEEVLVESDVQRYIESELSRISEAHNISDPAWPSAADVQTLVKNTGPFFIYASTLLTYIGNEWHEPVERLRQLIHACRTSSGTLDAVDDLYTLILDQTARGDDGREDTERRERIQLLLSTIVVAMEPLPVTVIARMFPIPISPKSIQKDVDSLKSILIGPAHQSSTPVRVLHASLPDFLQERCTDSRFRVNSVEHHKRMTLRCLEILNLKPGGLGKDMCSIVDASVPNAEVPDLKQTLATVAPYELRYAAKYWYAHLTAALVSNADISEFLEYLDNFCSKHLLHWLELMSLLNEVVALQRDLIGLVILVKNNPKLAGQQACRLLTDCERLVSTYHMPIKDHSLHVYHSALATTACSGLLSLYAEDCKGVPALITEREQMQGGWLKLLEGHERDVFSVAFSPDGKTIVSGSSDGTVRVWNAATGAEQHKTTGHKDTVFSVAFSPNGKTIVSGSQDHTVRVWDVATGVEQHKITGHEDPVISVAFSPDGKMIVSGSNDRTVRVWDAATGVEQHRIIGHKGTVRSVAFSLDGKMIVSGSNDQTVRVWDAATGVEQHKMTGHEGTVKSVAFSPDGKTVVSGSDDQTVRVWNAATGVEQHKMTGHKLSVTSVAFSPDGKTIASKDYFGNSCMWDADTGVQLTRTTSIEIDTSRHPSTEHLVFQLDSRGWISCSSLGGAGRRVCWIPFQRRGDSDAFAYSGEIVCIGASGGAVTILDFSPLGLAGR